MKNLLLSLFLLSTLIGNAQLRVSKFFSNHMVLQRNTPIKVWGKATSETKIKATFKSETYTTTADTHGDWILTVGTHSAGGPYMLKIYTKNEEIVLSDILIGDVWLCSGQSNMEWPVSKTQNADSVIQSSHYDNIRHFNILSKAPKTAKHQLSEKNGAWQVCNPKTVCDFTGVGYFFGLDLYKELEVPIGLVNSTWGGSGIQAWMPESSFAEPQL